MIKITLSMALLLASGAVKAAAITSITLTGGSFSINTSGDAIMPGEFAGDLNIGGYIGGARIASDLGVNSIGYFQYSIFGPILISTHAADDVAGGFRPLTGDITNGVLTLDLDSWTAWYNGQFFNQGASNRCTFSIGIVPACSSGNAITAYDAVTGAYTADWSAVVSSGSLATSLGSVGRWHIEGVVSTVPVPAAVWLFGTGLIGLVGFARRKKA